MIDYNLTETRGMSAGQIPLWYQIRHVLAARGEVIPPEQRALGTDISHWNGTINFDTMKSAGALYSYFKASQGTSLPDSQYNTNRLNTTIPFGSYHFLTTANGSDQANYFISRVGETPGQLPPVLDVELRTVASSIIKAYCQMIYTAMGVYPMIYTSSYFWSLVTGVDKTWVTSHCPLWVAHWGVDAPLLPTGWITYAVHQYSADGNRLGPTYGAPPEGDPDMDLNRTRLSWLYSYAPPVDWAHAIDDWARGLGYCGPEPE